MTRSWAFTVSLGATVLLAAGIGRAQDSVVTTIPAPETPGAGAPSTEPPPVVIVEPVEPEPPPPEEVPPPVLLPPPPAEAPPVGPGITEGVPPSLPPDGAIQAVSTANEPPPPAMEEAIADPAWTQIWFLPTARTLREGDLYAHYIGYTGLFGIQYGINGDADIGAGIGWFTLDLVTKYAFINRENMALSVFGMAVVPVVRDFWPYGEAGTKYFLMFGAGPLFSLWNDRAELDVGFLFLPFLQWEGESDAFDADFPIMPWVAGSVRIGDSARVMLGFTDLAALGLDKLLCVEHDTSVDPPRCTSEEPRGTYNMPVVLFGFRFHGRTFAADLGLGFPLSQDWWDVSKYFIAVPYVTFGHLW